MSTTSLVRWSIPLWICLSTGLAPAADSHFRVATYNTSLYRSEAGALVRDLEGGRNAQAKRIAEVIQRVRPDVILLNEFDYDPKGRAAELFCTKYLSVGQNGCEPIEYSYRFTGPVNTGRPSGRDLDKNGSLGDPADAVGYGTHEGQYGMLVLSRYAIDEPAIRTFQMFLWRDMPGALLPVDPDTGEPFYDDEDLKVLRLSSKSFWDVPIALPNASSKIAGEAEPQERVVHLLCSHPTPPVFDGPEDRNGRRNHDEIRMVADYISPQRSEYLTDDAGRRGGLPDVELFVIVGDLNADPVDGQGPSDTMEQIFKHRRVNGSFIPKSAGGPLVVRRYADQNEGRRGDPAHVTADFTGEEHGNLRIDYVLPSQGLTVIDGGVFWPPPDEPGNDAVTATDHRLVWLDLRCDAE
jgi:hypothetical protein